MNHNLAVPFQYPPSTPRSRDLVFYAPEQPDFLFSGQRPVQIICQSILRAYELTWTLTRHRLSNPLDQGHVFSQFDCSFPITLVMQGLAPGFYDLHVRLPLTEGNSVTATSTFGWYADQEPIYSVCPEDFEAFWQEALTQANKTELDLRYETLMTWNQAQIDRYNAQSAALPEHYDCPGELYQEVEVTKIDFAAPMGGRVFGWFAKPAGPGSFPGMLVLPGANNFARPAPVEHARHGYAAMDIQVHGFPVDLAEYPPLPEAIYTTPEQYTHYPVYLNAVRAVEALCRMPGVDASRLALVGGSQGGRLSFTTAALESRIGAAVPAIMHYAYRPWVRWTDQMRDQRIVDLASFSPDDIVWDDRTRIESYFDTVNFAPLIHCPVLMNAGLTDGVSPPTGIWAAYRGLKTQKEIIPLPNIAHDWSAAFDRYAWRWLESVFREKSALP